MSFTYFSHNGLLRPAEQAMVPLASIEYSYGFGVYETVRVTHGKPKFVDEHCARLAASAEAIKLTHHFKLSEIEAYITEVVAANEVESCNLKILLIGGKTAEQADLYILCLAPHFIDRKLYKTGVHCTTYEYERMYPHAKTLNMLPSYLAYRDAAEHGAHDALLINRHGEIVEGTRSNFYTIKNQTIFSPPESEILLGVTRDHALKLAKEQGFDVVEQTIRLNSLGDYDGAFLTSTSAKVLPIKSVGDFTYGVIPEQLHTLMKTFNDTY